MARDRHRAAWEDWGRIDPFWAVLTEADARHGRWDADCFFATGVDTVGAILAHTQRYGRPARGGIALDFGCGLGRVTRALAPHFERTYGLDVASTMIERAQQLDTRFGRSGVVFVLHDREDLSRFASGSVDFLSSLLVLQHLPSRDAIEGYLREFVRVLSPGGVAVVQLPVRVPPAELYVPLRTRGTRLLRAVGVSPTFLYERLGWEPEMLMSGIPYEETVAIFETSGGRLLDTPPEDVLPSGVVSRLYFVAPREGGNQTADGVNDVDFGRECARHDSNMRPLPPQGTPGVGPRWRRMVGLGFASRLAGRRYPDRIALPRRISVGSDMFWTFCCHF